MSSKIMYDENCRRCIITLIKKTYTGTAFDILLSKIDEPSRYEELLPEAFIKVDENGRILLLAGTNENSLTKVLNKSEGRLILLPDKEFMHDKHLLLRALEDSGFIFTERLCYSNKLKSGLEKYEKVNLNYPKMPRDY